MDGGSGRKTEFIIPLWGWIILVPVALFVMIAPWLLTHSGGSDHREPRRARIEALIVQFAQDHGRYPDDWTAIAAAYPDDLFYTFHYDCQYHPWPHVQTGQLEKVTLKRIVPTDWEGHEQYDVSLYGGEERDFPIYVER